MESGRRFRFFGSLQELPSFSEYITEHPFFSRFPASHLVKYISLKSDVKDGVPSSASLFRTGTGTGVLHFDFLSIRVSNISVKPCPVAPCVLLPAASSREEVK